MGNEEAGDDGAMRAEVERRGGGDKLVEDGRVKMRIAHIAPIAEPIGLR